MTFWDTANVYGDAGPGGFGANERLLGQVLADHRDEVTLATKMGIEGIAPGGAIRFRLDGSPENVRRRCEESLERLGTDHIDLYYLHRVDPDTPIEDTIGAMGDLVQAGKVRYVGVSEVTAEQLERAAAVHPITAVQSEWSLWTRDIEPEVLPAARRLGVGIVPFSPLGRGFFTGTLSGQTFEGADSRGRMPRFTDENRSANEAIVAVIAEVAEAHGVLPGQVALAWVHAQGDGRRTDPGHQAGRLPRAERRRARRHADRRRAVPAGRAGRAGGWVPATNGCWVGVGSGGSRSWHRVGRPGRRPLPAPTGDAVSRAAAPSVVALRMPAPRRAFSGAGTGRRPGPPTHRPRSRLHGWGGRRARQPCGLPRRRLLRR